MYHKNLNNAETTILEFKDEYAWLSNFALCTIKLDRKKYPSVEHAYQSAKSNDVEWKTFCMSDEKPYRVKKKSAHVELRKDWDSVRIEIMDLCLRQKFTQEPFQSMLLATGDAYIQEGNTWGDLFWGADLETGEGENHLGKLIMKIRDELKQGYER